MHFSLLALASLLAIAPSASCTSASAAYPSTASTSSSSSSSSSSVASAPAASSAAPAPGYMPGFSTVGDDGKLTFGKRYAVLNLDMINSLVGSVNTTSQGQAFIRSTARWIDAVHAKQTSPTTPLQIFTRIYFLPNHPEIAPSTPFSSGMGNATESQPGAQIYPAFKVTGSDVVLQKTRYYAGAGNALEEILSTQGIDTVVLSGIRSSGVILSTAYRLFDLNYKVFVISDNVIEAGNSGPLINQGILTGIIPKFPASVISLNQALIALQRSG